jgi:hypothetical protein
MLVQFFIYTVHDRIKWIKLMACFYTTDVTVVKEEPGHARALWLSTRKKRENRDELQVTLHLGHHVYSYSVE